MHFVLVGLLVLIKYCNNNIIAITIPLVQYCHAWAAIHLFFCVDIYHVYSKQRLAISCRNSRVRIRESERESERTGFCARLNQG